MITLDHAKEGICRSYISAIAAAGRHNLSLKQEFDYGVDGTVTLVEKRGKRLRNSGFCIDFQAKATWDWVVQGTEVVYDLEAKNYNDIVERLSVQRAMPLFLFLLCLPKDESTWVHANNDCLTVRHSLYYFRPTGAISSNTGTVRVKVPQTNLLTPHNLTVLLQDVKSGRL